MEDGKKDYLDGDHSFKNWFKIMWGNGYIFGFLLGLAGIVTQLIFWDSMIEMVKENIANGAWEGIMIVVAMLIPPAMVAIISYKGLWQFWNDLKNGKSR